MQIPPANPRATPGPPARGEWPRTRRAGSQLGSYVEGARLCNLVARPTRALDHPPCPALRM